MQATVVRMKKDLKGENNAREVSDALPFVEYEIHRQLVRTISECLLSLLMFFSTSLSTHFPPVRPFLPFISAPTGLVTRWAQLLITSKY